MNREKKKKGRDFEKPFSRKTFLQGIAALVVILRGWAVGQPLLASPSEAAGSGLRVGERGGTRLAR